MGGGGGLGGGQQSLRPPDKEAKRKGVLGLYPSPPQPLCRHCLSLLSFLCHRERLTFEIHVKALTPSPPLAPPKKGKQSLKLKNGAQ